MSDMAAIEALLTHILSILLIYILFIHVHKYHKLPSLRPQMLIEVERGQEKAPHTHPQSPTAQADLVHGRSPS